MHLEHSEGQWFAIQVRPKAEWCVAAGLGSKGYEHFLPSYISRRQPGDRSKNLRLPLFPGYVFCRFHSGVNGLIVTTPGVVRVVGYGKIPAAVEESEIAAVKTIVESGIPAAPWPRLQSGDLVRIASGPLRGLQGVLCSVNKRRQFVVSVNLLQRSALVELDQEWVTSAANSSELSSLPENN
jgi:transcription antitermination factor NusG